jgi:hypothetical protein
LGFYIRKTVKAGVFRFTLSQGGINVSTGIPGLRIGSGPRGTYVHMGRGGVYYRQYLGRKGEAASPTDSLPKSSPQQLGQSSLT